MANATREVLMFVHFVIASPVPKRAIGRLLKPQEQPAAVHLRNHQLLTHTATDVRKL